MIHLHRSHRYQQQALTMQRQHLPSCYLWSHLIHYSIFRPASLWSTCFHPLFCLRSPQAVAGSHLFLFASARLSLQLLLMCDSYKRIINSMSFDSVNSNSQSKVLIPCQKSQVGKYLNRNLDIRFDRIKTRIVIVEVNFRPCSFQKLTQLVI